MTGKVSAVLSVRALLFFAILVPVVIHGRLFKTMLDDVALHVFWGVAAVMCPPHPRALVVMDDASATPWQHVCVQDHHLLEAH